MVTQTRLDVSEVGDVTIVRLRDRRITEDRGIQRMAQELFHLVEGEDRMKLIVDFSSVDFLASSALGKLITLDKKAAARGGVLKLSSICPQLSQIFVVTKLDRLFDIEKDAAAALAAFQRSDGVPSPFLESPPASAINAGNSRLCR